MLPVLGWPPAPGRLWSWVRVGVGGNLQPTCAKKPTSQKAVKVCAWEPHLDHQGSVAHEDLVARLDAGAQLSVADADLGLACQGTAMTMRVVPCPVAVPLPPPPPPTHTNPSLPHLRSKGCCHVLNPTSWPH